MHILMAGHDGIHTARQIQWLLRAGHQITSLCMEDPCPSERSRSYRYVPQPSARGEKLYRRLLPHSLSKRLSSKILLTRFRNHVAHIAPDLVHVNWIGHAAYYLALTKIRPLVMTIWGTDINQCFHPDTAPDLRIRTAESLRRADFVIADSADMFDKSEVLAGRPLRSKLLPLGIDTSLFRPLPEEFGRAWRRCLEIPESSKVIVSIRAFAERYGHHLVLEAFAQALPQLRDAVLVFRFYNRTPGDPYEARLRTRAADLGIADRIRWVPPVPFERLPEIYALADLIVNYPLIDAFPVTFCEAAACGRRVVSCSLPAYEDTFATQYFHMLPPSSPSELATALAQEVNITMSQEAAACLRNRMETEYDEKLSAMRLVEIYGELLREARFSSDLLAA